MFLEDVGHLGLVDMVAVRTCARSTGPDGGGVKLLVITTDPVDLERRFLVTDLVALAGEQRLLNADPGTVGYG